MQETLSLSAVSTPAPGAPCPAPGLCFVSGCASSGHFIGAELHGSDLCVWRLAEPMSSGLIQAVAGECAAPFGANMVGHCLLVHRQWAWLFASFHCERCRERSCLSWARAPERNCPLTGNCVRVPEVPKHFPKQRLFPTPLCPGPGSLSLWICSSLGGSPQREGWRAAETTPRPTPSLSPPRSRACPPALLQMLLGCLLGGGQHCLVRMKEGLGGLQGRAALLTRVSLQWTFQAQPSEACGLPGTAPWRTGGHMGGVVPGCGGSSWRVFARICASIRSGRAHV